MEQDNKNLGPIRTALLSALGALRGIAPAEASDIIDGTEKLVQLIPNIHKDDVIGVFALNVRNVGGQIETEWLSLGDINLTGESAKTTIYSVTDSIYWAELVANGLSARDFDFSGTGGALYRGTVAVKPVPSVSLRREYLGKDIDRCGGSTLAVLDANGQMVPIQDGGTTEVWVSSNRFDWSCQGSSDSTTAPAGTRLVVVEWNRQPSREIDWWCFKELPW